MGRFLSETSVVHLQSPVRIGYAPSLRERMLEVTVLLVGVWNYVPEGILWVSVRNHHPTVSEQVLCKSLKMMKRHWS